MSIINSIPAEWRSVLKASTDVSVIDSLSNGPPTPPPTIRMESNNLVHIFDASSEQIFHFPAEKTDSTHC